MQNALIRGSMRKLSLFTAVLAVLSLGPASTADTVGVVDPALARWEVQGRDGSVEVFYFGAPGDVPLTGDWDCDGLDSPGMYRPSTGYVYLRDDGTDLADRRTFFGRPGDVLLAGDWDGDGCDTLGAYRMDAGRVLLSNVNGGAATLDYYFGVPGDKPFVGDFDADGDDEIGLHREATGFVYLRADLTTGVADRFFYYGIPGDRLVAGDWNDDGSDTVAVFRPDDARFYLRNSNSQGYADEELVAGGPPDLPVAGVFDGVDPAVSPAGPRSFTIVASGDFLIHSPVAAAARAYGPGNGVHDFTPMLDPVAAMVEEADLAVCHMETPLSPDNRNVSSYPLFNAPHELADAIAGAGYDTCSTASNHSIDKGATGVVDTLGVLDAAGLRHAGTARGPEEDVPTVYDVNGVTVGHLSYTYGLNGLQVPAGKDWLVNVIDPDAILADARRVRAAGAEFVVVSLHWGNEYQPEPTSFQVDLAHQLLASPDVDLILGHHAHVVQPVEKVGDEYVVYGMGNLLSNQRSGGSRVGTDDGVLIEVDVAEQTDGRFLTTAVRYTPTYVEAGTYRILPVAPTLGDPATPDDLRAALQVSWDRTVQRITMFGSPGVFPTSVPGPR